MKHYKLLSVYNDKLKEAWLCGGGICRNFGKCRVINHWHGMSDFGAYRVSHDDVTLFQTLGHLTWPAGTIVPENAKGWTEKLSYANPEFVMDAKGEDLFEFRTNAEGLGLYVNNIWVSNVQFAGSFAKIFKVDTIVPDETIFETEKEDGWFEEEEIAEWDFAGEAIIDPDSELFQHAIEKIRSYSGPFKQDPFWDEIEKLFKD